MTRKPTTTRTSSYTVNDLTVDINVLTVNIDSEVPELLQREVLCDSDDEIDDNCFDRLPDDDNTSLTCPTTCSKTCSTSCMTQRRSPRIMCLQYCKPTFNSELPTSKPPTSELPNSKPPTSKKKSKKKNGPPIRRSPRLSTIKESIETRDVENDADIINNLREGVEDDIIDMLNEMMKQDEKEVVEEEDESKLAKTKKGTTGTAKATIENDLSNGFMDLEEEVQCLVGGTSEKYVPQPKWEAIITDVVQAMRRFKQDV